MEKQKQKINFVTILLVVLLITMIASMILIVVTVNRTINAAISPIRTVNDALSTQVHQLRNPTPTVIPDPITIIREVQSLARLETIQYSVEKVITAEINQGVFGPLFGDRLLFVAHGYVIAGIDLSQLEPEQLRLEDGILFVSLPEAEVFVATLDNENSYVYDRETGVLRKSDKNLETAARQIAEQEIERAALEDGILEQAQQNGEVYLERLFNSLGYEQIIFDYLN